MPVVYQICLGRHLVHHHHPGQQLLSCFWVSCFGRERRLLFVLCKSFSLKESSLSLHHFVFIWPVCKPVTAYPNFVHFFFKFSVIICLHRTFIFSLCLSTCTSNSNLWSSLWGKSATDTHTFPQMKEASVLLTTSHSHLIEIPIAAAFSNEESPGKKNGVEALYNCWDEK